MTRERRVKEVKRASNATTEEKREEILRAAFPFRDLMFKRAMDTSDSQSALSICLGIGLLEFDIAPLSTLTDAPQFPYRELKGEGNWAEELRRGLLSFNIGQRSVGVKDVLVAYAEGHSDPARLKFEMLGNGFGQTFVIIDPSSKGLYFSTRIDCDELITLMHETRSTTANLIEIVDVDDDSSSLGIEACRLKSTGRDAILKLHDLMTLFEEQTRKEANEAFRKAMDRDQPDHDFD